MKKFIKKISYIMLFFILSFFIVGVSELIEFIIRGNCNITSNKYIYYPLLLIGTFISVLAFKKIKIIDFNFSFDSKLSILSFFLGFTILQFVILLLLFLGANLTIGTTFSTIIQAVFFAPIIEELKFRAVLTDILNDNKNKINIITIIFSSLLWTVIHQYGFTTSTLFVFIDGLILGFLYQKTRNVIACIMYHVGANLSVYFLLIINNNKNMILYSLLISVIIIVLSIKLIVKNYLLKASNS